MLPWKVEKVIFNFIQPTAMSTKQVIVETFPFYSNAPCFKSSDNVTDQPTSQRVFEVHEQKHSVMPHCLIGSFTMRACLNHAAGAAANRAHFEHSQEKNVD